MYKIRDSLAEEKAKEARADRNYILFAAFLLLILAVIVALNTFVYTFVLVDGRSMMPTLSDGDVLVANKIKDFERGDIVIIEGKKINGEPLIKRVIAVGGDSVKIENGRVYLKKSGEADFTELEEPYLESEGITYYPDITDPDCTEAQIREIPEGEVFFLGDNRTDSSDSRSSFGNCKSEDISGVIENWSLSARPFFNFIHRIFRPIGELFGKKA